ncbi:OsmC family protein [Galbibacter sp. BG1]|uniref:OsmC family protein n=1 Tax=Galbibacter sp. BG1 TaxID=1170699 RepID=UPI0015BFEB3D|nr:OsmC family protein [Galbibacter sp. BG1]QLE01901.1 OsmC family protein [Galbibacter sp. BG1]
MEKNHFYKITVQWTGNLGKGTRNYRSYTRDHKVEIDGKPDILGSSDPAFLGDKNRHNPEEFFLASIASCHMLWYLHFCAVEGVVITDYRDLAEGVMEEDKSGSGKFTKVVLRPQVEVFSADMKEEAIKLHAKANDYCFIANSLNFPVEHKPVISVMQ